jgi:hypothetical protein
VFDAAAWAFVDALLARTRAHAAAAWLDVAGAFAGANDATWCRSA